MPGIEQLNREITTCNKCQRLVEYLGFVSRKKVRRHSGETYWGKPVPGFGDPDPGLLIIGLAPAAHGANRTGRMFTGDSSGNWLFRALYKTGFASKPESLSAGDGMKMKNVFITSSLHCAPPKNKPTKEELANCSLFLEKEMALFPNVKVVICLGHIAFDGFCSLVLRKKLAFGHGNKYVIDNGIVLISSYHPSRQNTQTGRLKWMPWLSVFKEAKKYL